MSMSFGRGLRLAAASIKARCVRHGSTGGGQPRSFDEMSEYIKRETLDGKRWDTISGAFPHDKVMDRRVMRAAMSLVACLTVVPAFIIYYFPDIGMQDWVQREAFLQLREREARGVFPISKDFVDPAKLELPSDEELGDTNVLI